jgi:signal transduction histidine kinase
VGVTVVEAGRRPPVEDTGQISRIVLWVAGAAIAFYLASVLFLIVSAWRIDSAYEAAPSRDAESILVGQTADFLLDFGSIVTTDDLLSGATDGRFTLSSGEVPVFGMHYFDNGMLWLRFIVPEVGGDDGQVTVRLSDPRARTAKLVVVDDAGTIERVWTQHDASRRSGLGSRTPAFHFARGEIEGATAYIGFHTLSILRGSVFVETRRAYEAWDRNHIVIPSVLGGALTALGIYLAVTGLLLREWHLIAAGAMSVTMMTTISGGPGLFHSELLPGSPALADVVAYLPRPLAVSAWLAFLIGYLGLWRSARQWTYVLIALALIIPFQSVNAALKIGLDIDTPVPVEASLPMLSGILAGAGTLAWFAFRGNRQARIFLLCWLPLFIGMMIRFWIILFPTPRAALALADDPYVDVVASMVALAVAMVIDIQAREAKLRRDAEEKEHRFREYAEIATDSFFETDRDGRVSNAAGPLARELGLEPGADFVATLAARLDASRRMSLAPLERSQALREPVKGLELHVPNGDGRGRWFAFNASPWSEADGAEAGIRGTIVDMTAQIERRDKEAESGKLVAMGRIAGGIAHEVNNLLHPIINLARRVRDRYVSEAEARHMLDLVIDSGKRAGEVVGGVLAAVSPQKRRGPLLPINVATERAVAAAQASLPPSMHIDLRLGPVDRPRLPLGEMLQVIANLVQNAARAIGPGGLIAVALDKRGDDRVVLSVIDDGEGMTSELRRTALEPFVTSRADGNGLGLAAVAAIVDTWGGAIDIQSAPGQGTVIAIEIPADADVRSQGQIESK